MSACISNKAKLCLRTTVIMLWPNDGDKPTCTHKVDITESRSFSRSETLTSTARNQLDSGYDSDISAPSQRLTSTSDTEKTDSDWFDKFENMDLDNDVFETARLPLGDRPNNNTDLDNDEFESVIENEGDSASNMEYDTDSADDEVEELLGNGLKEENCVSHKSALSLSHRPSAPVPQFIHSEMVTKCTCCNMTLSKFESQTTSVPCNIHFFRPIGRRCNTKRRTLHNGVSESAFRRCDLDFKSNSSSLTQSAMSCRRRTRSECLKIAEPLPDVVASTTDRPRPASLPDIVTLCQQNTEELGQELRRIADEFETVFADRRKRMAPNVYWSMLNCSLTVYFSSYLKVIRRLLSPCQHESLDDR